MPPTIVAAQLRNLSESTNEVTATNTGTVNNFDILVGGALRQTMLRMNNATSTTITGLKGGAKGRRILVASIGAGTVVIANQNTGSISPNRINAGNGDVTLVAGKGVAALEYDATSATWRLTSVFQG